VGADSVRSETRLREKLGLTFFCLNATILSTENVMHPHIFI